MKVPSSPSEQPASPVPTLSLGSHPGLSWAVKHPPSLATQPVEGTQGNLYVCVSLGLSFSLGFPKVLCKRRGRFKGKEPRVSSEGSWGRADAYLKFADESAMRHSDPFP